MTTAASPEHGEVGVDLAWRETKDLLAIGKRLPEMPHLAARFAEGSLPYSKVREVIRVATPETDEQWTQRALESACRELETQVAASKPGALPPTPATLPPRPARGRMVIDTDAAHLLTIREAMAVLRQQGDYGEDVDDGAVLAEITRRFLADNAADATTPLSAARHRVTIDHCPDCKKTHVGPHEASESVRAVASCDAEVIDLTRPEARITRQIPPATRRAVLERDGRRCLVPHCRAHLWLDIHHIRARAEGGTHGQSNLAVICPIHHDLVHRQLLILQHTGDGVRFFHADGTPFGARAPSSAAEVRRPALAEAVLQALDVGPLCEHDLQMALGLPFGRAGRVLSMLRAQAAVLRLETGEWAKWLAYEPPADSGFRRKLRKARVDRLVHAAPTWVGRADGPVADSA